MKPAKRTLQQEVEAAVIRSTGHLDIFSPYGYRAVILRAIRRVFAKHRRGK